MLKKLIQRAARSLGLEVRRSRDDSLPFLHEISCPDAKFVFWIANSHAKDWWYKPILHVDAELRTLRALCQPQDVVFDVGAHHGFHTLLFSIWAGIDGQVHAFEANPENALVLGANVGFNRRRNCACVHTAVGAASGTATIVGETVVGLGTNAGQVREIGMTSLDDYCSAEGIAKVDLLKIDVEGYECEVLKGARNLLSSCPKIALELHLDDLARYGSSTQMLADHLDLSRHHVQMMVRPDWETLIPIAGLEDLPRSGVVNLFASPKEPR